MKASLKNNQCIHWYHKRSTTNGKSDEMERKENKGNLNREYVMWAQNQFLSPITRAFSPLSGCPQPPQKRGEEAPTNSSSSSRTSKMGALGLPIQAWILGDYWCNFIDTKAILTVLFRPQVLLHLLSSPQPPSTTCPRSCDICSTWVALLTVLSYVHKAPTWEILL